MCSVIMPLIRDLLSNVFKFFPNNNSDLLRLAEPFALPTSFLLCTCTKHDTAQVTTAYYKTIGVCMDLKLSCKYLFFFL